MLARPIALSLSLCALAPFAPAQSSLWTTFGTSGSDQFGRSIDAGGDYDGDGVPDLVVGSPFHGSGGNTPGRVQIVSGAAGAVVWSVDGTLSEGFGMVVAGLRDVDGDLVPDVLASRGWYDSVRVLSGANGATIRTHAGTLGNVFGQSIGGLGDLDADGRGDYAIFANAEGPAGVVRVYSGTDGAVLHTYTGSDAPGGAQYQGDAVGVGDLDADGHDDYALVYTVLALPSSRGRVSVRSGASGAEMLAFLGTIDTYGFQGVSLLGDLDGDGVAELAVGEGTAYASFPGRVTARSLATGAIVRTFWSPQPVQGDGFGSTVAALADVDHDGITDLAVAGAAPRGAWVYSGATGALLQSYQRGGSCSLPLCVAALPDLDFDGRADLVIAEPCANYGAQALTRIAAFSGATVTEHGANGCFGDGTSAACPCANPGASGVGCTNTTGVGASLRAHGSSSVTRDDLWFDAAGLPGNFFAPTYLFVGNALAGGGLGVAHFAGVRCAGGTLKRLGWHRWKGAGVASWPSGLGSIGGWSAGSTRHFQALYRDVTHPCATANLTNLVTLAFTP